MLRKERLVMKKLMILMLIAVFTASVLLVGVGCKEEAAEEAVEEEAAEEAVEEEAAEEAVEEEAAEEAVEEDSKYGGTFVLGSIGEPEHLDQGLVGWTTNHFICDNINGYLAYIWEGEIKLQLAESYKYIDDVTIEMSLKKGVKFHNGREVVAEDVKNSIMRSLTHPETTRQGLIGAIESVDVIDNYNFIINLSKPSPELLTVISVVPIIPIEELDEEGFMKDNPVGCGPFKFVSWEKGSQIILERFDDYWEKDEDGNSLPYLDKLVFVFPGDASSRVAGLMTGEIDFTSGVSLADVVAASNGEMPGIVPDGGQDDSLSQVFLVFNFNRDLWNDLKVRQAVQWAIDRQQLCDLAWSGLATPKVVSVTKNFKDYYDPEWDMYLEQDQALAKQMLEEAGYADGVAIDLKCPNNAPYPDIAQIVAAQLTDIGFKVDITLMEQASYQDAVLGGKDFDITFAGSAFPPLERLLTNMHTRSDGIGNFGNFSDPKMDELVDEFLQTNDGPRATEIYREIWGWRLENAAPHITLSTYAAYNLMSDKVNGWEGNKGLDWFFQNVWLSE